MADIRVPNSEACVRVLRQTPGLLRSLLAPATRAQLDWQPSPERWSIGMVLAHLAEVELKGFQSRFGAMLHENCPRLPAYDQLALFRTQTRFDPYAEMARFEEARSVSLALVDSMPEGAGERLGEHEELGMLTIAQLLNEFAFHDLGHIRQVMELYRAKVFYPEMGVYQGYYKINP